MFTLTYDDIHIPKAKVFRCPETQTIKYYDVTKRPLKPAKDGTPRFKELPEYGCLIGTYTGLTDYSNFIAFIQKATRSYKYGLDNDFTRDLILRYCRKKDIQNFFKRFRFHISEVCTAKVSFYCAAEYGPCSFRPHYHVIISFDDPYLVENLEVLLHKSWKFGEIRRIESFKSANGAAKYVAGYLNSFSCLPCYLAVDGLRPFSLHSQYYGTALNTYLRDTLYNDVRRATSETTLPSPFGKYTYFPNIYHQSRLFPRCYNYEFQNFAGKYQLYTCYDFYRKLYRTNKCSELVRYIIRDRFRRSTFLKTLDLFVTPDFPPPENEYQPRYVYDISADPYNTLSEYEQTVYNRLYSAFNLSRHFYKFCCVKQQKKLINKKWHTFTRLRDPETVLRLIDEYYSILPLTKLAAQYTAQIDYASETFDTDYILFYPFDSKYYAKYAESPYIQMINRQKDYDYSQNIKHKEINDANGIFCNP